ncbi:molecular chaperone TorD family protein [Vibrio parahaemolyticus]|nr:molecular chaperone TorD family protein [Vibrio parahaemolyticus]EIT7131663.1 molecular chaperone TorD family protein [Vibrio parahaemolyticus]EIZ1368547.1 molecular chaperone TorD family protein [Vibrio parahaemolyticus]EIZ4252158.1 molecular chaperone TorD family protein [Vibrio parahaemolyticus]
MENNTKSLALVFNILAILYRYPPVSIEFKATAKYFSNLNWYESWPILTGVTDEALTDIQQNLTHLQKLEQAEWKHFFGEEFQLSAPPWGAVYLDPEQAMNNSSTIATEHFLASNNIKIETEHNEPVDHVGLCFMVLAHLALEHDKKLLNDFFGKHIEPWLYKYLATLRVALDTYSATNQKSIAALYSFANLTEITCKTLFIDGDCI